MRRDFKVIGLVAAGLGVLVSLVIFGVGTPFTPAAAPAWLQVHVGMQRSNILALVGSAQTGMHPEKIVEPWYRDGNIEREWQRERTPLGPHLGVGFCGKWVANEDFLSDSARVQLYIG